MFEDFDFRLLDDASFKEDSVREELLVPILTRLGYTASGEKRIIRSMPLVHPFVKIGTKKNRIYIIPDYILAFENKPLVVIDAKAPSQEILHSHYRGSPKLRMA